MYTAYFRTVCHFPFSLSILHIFGQYTSYISMFQRFQNWQFTVSLPWHRLLLSAPIWFVIPYSPGKTFTLRQLGIGGFHKWGHPKTDGLEWKIPFKWMIGGYPCFRKPPIRSTVPLLLMIFPSLPSQVKFSGTSTTRNRHVLWSVPWQVLLVDIHRSITLNYCVLLDFKFTVSPFQHVLRCRLRVFV